MEKEALLALVKKAKEGQQQALDALFTETYNDVYYFALKTVKDEDMACDVTQESFITIFKTISSLQEPAAYVAWSRQITYHHCLKFLGKNREVTVEENEDGGTVFDTLQEEKTEFIPDAALDQEDFRKTIMAMIDSLSPEQRAAVLMYYFDEISIKEIAAVQNVSEGTVKSRLNYARKAIKSSVEDYEKKNNVKLHSVAIVPLLLWLLCKDKLAHAMPVAVAKTTAAAAAAAAGTKVAATAAAKTTGFAVWQKVVAGVAAGVLAVGSGAAVAKITDTDREDTVSQAETTEATTEATDPQEPSRPEEPPAGDLGEPPEESGFMPKDSVYIGYGEDPYTWYHILSDRTLILTVYTSTEDTVTGHFRSEYITDEYSEIYESDFTGTVVSGDGNILYIQAMLDQPRELSVLDMPFTIDMLNLYYDTATDIVTVSEYYSATLTQKSE